MTQVALASGPVIVPPQYAAEYLARMDIEVADIYAAIGNGEVAAASIDGYHPRNVAGLARWIALVGCLRRRLIEGGRWRLGDGSNRPVCRHLDHDWTLAVICGDAATGDVDSFRGPQATRRKGVATARSVQEQGCLITLTELVSTSLSAVGDEPPAGNWFLLYHRDVGGVRLEVSLPLGFDEVEGQFTGWAVRVIIDDWVPEGLAMPHDVGYVGVAFQILSAA